MALRIGGETPIIKYGTELTVEGPAGTTAAAPVRKGEIFKLGGTAVDGTGYKVVAAVAGDDSTNAIIVMALHDLTDLAVPLGVKVLGARGMTQVRRLGYVSGAAPTLGQSIEVSTTNVRKIVGKAFAVGDGYVLAIDTSALDVEVLV